MTNSDKVIRDRAPGWQFRCPRCGMVRPYGEIGIRRWAASRGKRILIRCPECRRLVWAIVERTPGTAPESDGSR